MAKQVEGFAPQYRKYDWDLWFNGEVWQLTRGEDFQCAAHNMRVMAQNRARRRGLKIHTSIQDETILFIQAYKDDA